MKKNQNYDLQPTQIENYLTDKKKRLYDNMGWTGEFTVSAKDILDMLIDLKQPDNLPEPEIFEWKGEIFEWKGEKFKIIPLPKGSKSVCSGCYFEKKSNCPMLSDQNFDECPAVVNNVDYIFKLLP